jgi:hypothetical protein
LSDTIDFIFKKYDPKTDTGMQYTEWSDILDKYCGEPTGEEYDTITVTIPKEKVDEELFAMVIKHS